MRLSPFACGLLFALTAGAAAAATPDAPTAAGPVAVPPKFPALPTHPFPSASQPPYVPPALPPPVHPAAAGECAALPAPRSGPLPFASGERLRYDVDVMGVRAAAMTVEVLPRVGGGSSAELPVRVHVESNTFFDKVRRVRADIRSNLRARDLRPSNFREDLLEGGASRIADVTFPAPGAERIVKIDWRTPTTGTTGQSRHAVAPDALDYAGAIELFRALPLKIGQSFCFDTYGLRRIWRVQAKVESREGVSVPAGEFTAWHVSGVATRVGAGTPITREFHVWISDDARRLPVAAMGVIDLGPVRASLTSVARSDGRLEPARPGGMEW